MKPFNPEPFEILQRIFLAVVSVATAIAVIFVLVLYLSA
jgi:hypothetical protein